MPKLSALQKHTYMHATRSVPTPEAIRNEGSREHIPVTTAAAVFAEGSTDFRQ